MTGVSDESAPSAQLTRRDRRIARSRARRTGALVGWAGYGIGVFVVIAAAAWLAVRGGAAEVPGPAANTLKVQAVVTVPERSTTTTTLGGVAQPVPIDDTSAPSTSTTTTTAPVLSAALTPGPSVPAP